MLGAAVRMWPSVSLTREFDRQARTEEHQVTALRGMIWAYFALLIVEGALRKWTIPALSAPLLVVRDPVVLLIYLQALRCRRFPVTGPMLAFLLLLSGFILLALFQIIAGIGGGPVVAAYGLRTNFLHLPLIFVIAQVFSRRDVIRLGRWVLILSIPMAGLMILQFLSSPGSWINKAVMADAQQISFALGKIRPAGTFSFATGVSHFFVLTTAFLIYGLVDRRAGYSRWLLGGSLFAVAVVQPVSGSRLLVLGCGLVVLAALMFAVVGKGGSSRILVVALMICAALALLSLTSFFREAVSVFMVRWDNASGGSAESGLTGRILGSFLDAFALTPQIGWLGRGIGVGTNVASSLMTGSVQFLLAEGEWSRIILESGPLLGFSFLAYRVWLAGGVAVRAVTAARQRNLLAWLLAWDACRSLITEQMSQPTNLGFMVLISGLSLAAMPSVRTTIATKYAVRSKFPQD